MAGANEVCGTCGSEDQELRFGSLDGGKTWSPLGAASLPDQCRCPDSFHVKERDYFYLCGECGFIGHEDAFAYVRPDYDHEIGPAYRPNRPDESDPHVWCPSCGHFHYDSDDEPGMWDGTWDSITAEKARLLADPVWAEAWTA